MSINRFYLNAVVNALFARGFTIDVRHQSSKSLSAKRDEKIAISRHGGQMRTTNSTFRHMMPRRMLLAFLKTIFGLTLFGTVIMSGGAAFAKSLSLNPAQLGTFCPPGSEPADAKHTNLLSVRDQAEIKKNVQGFMALDATARRSLGHPLGPQDYWERGYTVMFDVTKEVPHDGVLYIAYRFTNTCARKDGAWATILLDIAGISGRKIEKIFQGSLGFVSPQRYWDAISKKALVLPDKDSTPEQPLIFTVLPLTKNGYGDWWIEQSEVPALKKFIKAHLQAEIEKTNKFSQCQASMPRDPGACASNEQEKLTLLKYSRPAWSIYPKDMRLGITSN